MTNFRISFDGPAVKNGEIDVNELAPALLALGELFSSANLALNNDRAEAKLKIKASEKGSFEALMSLDVSFIADMLDSIAAHPDRITAADQLLDLLIKGGTIVGAPIGFFQALKLFKGKKPDSSNQRDDGTTEITVSQSTVVVDHRTAILLQDFRTREATEKFVRVSLKAQGVSQVTLTEEHSTDSVTSSEPLVLTQADIASTMVPEPTDEDITTESFRREALLKIVSAQFEGGYLWRFTDGTNTFTASMEAEDFNAKLDRSEIVLAKDDTLHCVIDETQQLVGNRLKTEARIIEVKKHISGARQLKLF